MNLLKISNRYLTKRACSISSARVPVPAPRSVLSTPLASLSAPCAVHGLDGQHFYGHSDLLRAHETSDDVKVLRARLHEAVLQLVATQLAYKKLALSVGSCSCTHEAAFRLPRTSTGLQPGELLLCSESRLLDDPSKPSPSDSRLKNPSSQIRVHDGRNAKVSMPASAEEELDEVKRLMTAAHHDDLIARRKCRNLKRTADQTPKPQRSTAQNLLLDKWRKPRLREIFVDASRHGIAVVLDDRWLAWKFVVGHPELREGPDGSIDITWAELVAAEMGIRTLVAANYGYLPVSLRSDNTSVVDALKARQWKKHPRLDGIVQQIVAMCHEVGLELGSDWVGTKENPADNPSRGEYPPRERTFYHRPSIPSHLSELIHEVDCVE